jgi:hypothetical protein
MTVLDERPSAPSAPAVAPEVARGELHVLNRTGDTTLTWDPANDTEVTAARQMFDKMRGNGYAAYRMENEARGELIREFDKSAAHIVMSPQIIGG